MDMNNSNCNESSRHENWFFCFNGLNEEDSDNIVLLHAGSPKALVIIKDSASFFSSPVDCCGDDVVEVKFPRPWMGKNIDRVDLLNKAKSFYLDLEGYYRDRYDRVGSLLDL